MCVQGSVVATGRDAKLNDEPVAPKLDRHKDVSGKSLGFEGTAVHFLGIE